MPAAVVRFPSQLVAAVTDSSVDEISRAVTSAPEMGLSPVRALVRAGILRDESQLRRLLLQLHSVEYESVRSANVDPALANRLPLKVAERNNAVVLREESDGSTVVAVENPLDPVARRQITSALSGAKVTFVGADGAEIASLRARIQRSIIGQVTSLISEDDASGEAVADVEQASEVANQVESWIAQAIRARASDIHFEPSFVDRRQVQMAVRIRVDGTLRTIATVQGRTQTEMIATWLKAQARLDIANHRRAEDGELILAVDGAAYQFRVATKPSHSRCESIVLRRMDARLMDLEEIGFSSDLTARFVEACSLPHGMVLVTGSTGSGKTTTLYAVLSHLAGPGIKVHTIEDPVEFVIPGTDQSQVDHAKENNFSFAAALRAFLRMDPDIILVGEIRDQETATVATEAAQTGHMVLSTLHTNRASDAPRRLVEIGAPIFNVTNNIRAVLSQRLVPLLCQSCHIEVDLPDSYRRLELEMPTRSFKAKRDGCSKCDYSGTAGRRAVAELFIPSEQYWDAFREGASSPELRQIAVKDGMEPIETTLKTMCEKGELGFETYFRHIELANRVVAREGS